MSVNVKQHLEEQATELANHMKTLSKDTPEYDQSVNNFAILTKSLNEIEQAEAERSRKERERIQSAKQAEAELALKEAQADEQHAQFMIRTIVDCFIRLGETAVFVDLHDREMFFEKDDSRTFKFGSGLISRLPFMKNLK